MERFRFSPKSESLSESPPKPVGAIVKPAKLFFTDDAIEENILSFLATVMKLRPKGVKGAPSETNFVKDVMLSSTMGKRSYRVQKYATRALQHAGGID